MPLLYIALAFVAIVLLSRLINRYVPIPEGAKRILNIALVLIVVGMLMWVVNTYIPMAGSIKVILNVFVVVATCVGILQGVGLWSGVVRFWNNLTNHRTTSH